MLRTLRQPTAQALTVTALLFAGASSAPAATLEARSSGGDLILVNGAAGETYVSRNDGGGRVTLPLSPASLVHSFAAAGEQWYAAAVDRAKGGPHLVVLKGSGVKVKELPSPPVTDAAQLREPSLMVDELGLKAMAWIEGRAPRQQVVKVASWTAGGWREPATVSPRGPGSQMALSAAVLADGSCLLAWAAYDGNDDEIMWSRWSAAEGSGAPTRIAADNAVPDITPHLWATPDGGAFAAWSRYDGHDYRVNLARFDGETWSEPEVVGPKGSVYPTFHGGPEGAILVYQMALPRGWNVAELDGTGRVVRETGVETEESEPPVLSEVTSRGVSLKWIDDSGAQSAASGLAWRPVR